MKHLELALSLFLPSLIITIPLSLLSFSISDLLLRWFSTVALLFLYSSTFLNICTTALTKPTNRLSHLKSYFKKEILLLLVVNLVFGYCISGTVNLWRGQVLHDNLALFWSLLIASYFTFDVLICFKFQSKPNAVQLKWFYKLKLNLASWIRESAIQLTKAIRISVPIYVLFYKDITVLLGRVIGYPSEELSFYFLVRPSTVANILLTSFFTLLLLNVGHNAVMHVLIHSTIQKNKGQTSVEKCAESLQIPALCDLALADLLRTCKSSYAARQAVFRLQDGHPVIWHIVYKKLVDTLVHLNKALSEKSAESTKKAHSKVETAAPVGRALLSESKPTHLYSVRDTPTVDTSLRSVRGDVGKVLSGIASDAAAGARACAKDYLLNCRIGKYLLAEQQDLVLENKLSHVPQLLLAGDLVGLLVCAAPQEDKYGVVQLVLPDILNTTAQALRSLEQVPVSGNTAVTQQTGRLKRSLHTLLYHVTNTYKGSVFNLTLQADTVTLVQQFV